MSDGMEPTKDILLLAGSAEARQIAEALQVQGRRVRAVMSEPPRGPNPMPVPFEVCSVPDDVVLARAMAGAAAVVDASHGFDGQMSRAGSVAAARMGLPFVSLSRQPWDVAEECPMGRGPGRPHGDGVDFHGRTGVFGGRLGQPEGLRGFPRPMSDAAPDDST